MENLKGAKTTQDKEIQRDIILDEIAHLIEKFPYAVAGALEASGIKVKNPESVRELINKVSDNAGKNPRLQNRLSQLILKLQTGELEKFYKRGMSSFSNANGEGWAKVKGFFKGVFAKDGKSKKGKGLANVAKGGASGGVVGVVAGAVGSAFDFLSSRQTAKNIAEQNKQILYQKLLGGRKRNWIPIAIVAGVFLIGGIVIYHQMKNKG